MNLWCPSVANGFPLSIPESLGAKTAIPDQLSDKIMSIQGKGVKTIPAKYYHFIEGAVLGCELASECNISTTSASLINAALSNLYRGERLCTLIKEYGEDLKGLQSQISSSSRDYATDIKQEMSKIWTDYSEGKFPIVLSPELNSFFASLKNVDPDVRSKKFDNYLALLAAADLHNRLYIGGPNSWLHAPTFLGREDGRCWDRQRQPANSALNGTRAFVMPPRIA